ncbi:MAG TPA: prepilin peptidase [Gaiellaceae bacterium]
MVAAAVVAACVLVGLTFAVWDSLANALLFSVAQVLLVAIAAVDAQTRKIPNELVLALAGLALVPRAVAERSSLAECAIAGAAVFAVALVLAIVSKGGLGMGDVKLAAALGLLLGAAVVWSLLLGTLVGAVAAVVVLRRSGRRAAFAYGPYLALGGALGILLLGPPPLS